MIYYYETNKPVKIGDRVKKVRNGYFDYAIPDGTIGVVTKIDSMKDGDWNGIIAIDSKTWHKGLWIGIKCFSKFSKQKPTKKQKLEIKRRWKMVETVIEKTKIEKKQLCYLKLTRDNMGVSLTVKSEIIEEFMKQLSGNNTGVGSGVWGAGMSYYKIPPLTIENDGTYKRPPQLMNWGMETIIEVGASRSNLSFLRAVGLKDGVTIKFPGLFLSKDIQYFKDDFKNFMSKFYTNYIKLSEFEILITTNE